MRPPKQLIKCDTDKMRRSIPFFFYILFLCTFFFGLKCNKEDVAPTEHMARKPLILPDYSDIILPSNIAPLNFRILEAGDKYRVTLFSLHGDSIGITSKSSSIRIPMQLWKTLLSQNSGNSLCLRVAVRQRGRWVRFETIENHIAKEAIDPFLVYRILNPAFNLWKTMGIYQRNVESFEEVPVLRNEALNGCLNCHSFCRQRPDTWSLHMRYTEGGMLVAKADHVQNLDTRTDQNPFPAAYTAWHPSGETVAFSTDEVKQFFHAAGENRDVLDMQSDLYFLDPETHAISSAPQIARPDYMEVLPTWSPDGRYLYFCSAPQIDSKQSFKGQFRKIYYELMRVPYDNAAGAFGVVETVLSLAGEHQSISHPKISPDGRYLMYCVANYGYFTIYHPESNLSVMDLKTGRTALLDLNSEQSESYHSWSSNSRWVVFSSKRDDGIYTRLYLCYMDENGRSGKPFVLPQEDPCFYDHFLWVYNVPELTTASIPQSEKMLLEASKTVETCHAK